MADGRLSTHLPLPRLGAGKGVELALVGLLGHFGHHTRKDATGSVLVSESKWLQESG